MKRKLGIKGRLLICFLSFSVIILAMLWIFDVVFLDDAFEMMKIQSVRAAAEKFEGLSDENLELIAKEEAESIDLCTSVYDASMNLVTREHASGRCVIHGLNRSTAQLLYENTKKCEGMRFESRLPADEVAETLQKNEISKNPFQEPFIGGNLNENFLPDIVEESPEDSILISCITKNDQGEERYILLSSVLVPVSSTVLTIRLELTIVSAVLILTSLVMLFFISRSISKPLVELNLASKTLSEGRFERGGVTGYREIEELSHTLSAAAEEISQVDRFQKELLANVSHDLRTPLTLISGYSEVMRDIPGENTPENLQAIIDETNRLSGFVSDLLDLSKAEFGMKHICLEPIELFSFVKEICQRYKKMTELQGFDFQVEMSQEEAWVMADRVKLDQAVSNLLNNAINYSGKDFFIGVRLSLQNEYAVVEIVDHGSGIAPEKLEHIWNRYYRAEENHNRAVVGSGLGLSIVKKILDQHKALYGVDSKVGFGSRFWFALKEIKSK